MTEPSKYEQLTAEVAEAELIPTGRFLSAEEIELLEVLATRLRAALVGDGSEEITRLLRRVSAIRTYARRSHATSTSATATGKRPATPTATERAAATPIPPPAGTGTSKRKKAEKEGAVARDAKGPKSGLLPPAAPHRPGRQTYDPIRRADPEPAYRRIGGTVAQGAVGANAVHAGARHPGVPDRWVVCPGP